MSRSYRYCLDQKCDRKLCNPNITASFICVYYFSGKVHSDLLLQWGSSLNLLAANNSNTVLILCEHLMSAHFSQQVAAVQLTPTQLSITQFTTGAHLALQSEIHIKGVCVTKVSGIEKWKCINETSLHLRGDTEGLYKSLALRTRWNWYPGDQMRVVKPTGFGDSLEWQADHCVWAHRDSSSQYRYDF